MHLLYNIGVRCYGFAIRMASVFNPKAKKWILGRKNWLESLPELSDKKVIWFHCASLGEFDQGLPLMSLIKQNHPESFLLVTFFSPSGFEHYHKRDHRADHVCYLPLDTPSNARKFIEKISPEKVFFVKYEFWANYIFAAKQSGSSLYNVSGLFRENHRFFKWYGGFFRKVLMQFNSFFVQNESSVTLLKGIGLSNVTVCGDSRFDRVIENSANAKDNEIIATFKGDEDLVILGSSWPVDEMMLMPWINSTSRKILLAPHQVDEAHVSSIEKALTRNVVRYSKAELSKVNASDVIILDTIGHLASAYKYGQIAYVGGGFSGSLHNILEPAVFGLPVIFGPKHARFPEAAQFIEGGFGFSVSTTAEFEAAFHQIETNIEKISEKEKAFVASNAGASKLIYMQIFN